MNSASSRERVPIRSLGWMLFVLFIALALPLFRLGAQVRRCWLVHDAAQESNAMLQTEPPSFPWLAERLGKFGHFALSRPKGVGLVFDERYSRPEIDRLVGAVAGMESLTDVRISGTGFTDDDLLRLRTLTQLRDLTLTMTSVTARGLMILDAFPDLRKLDLSVTVGVDDRSLVPISRAQALEELSLSGTSVSGAGLAQLTSLRRLQRLNLDHTGVDDAGLAHLQGLPDLRALSLSGTEVSDEAVATLRQAVPGLEISDD